MKSEETARQSMEAFDSAGRLLAVTGVSDTMVQRSNHDIQHEPYSQIGTGH